MDNSTEKDFDSNNSGLSKAWQFRFKFYEENGLSKFKQTAQYKEKSKALGTKQRFLLTFNIAGIFGPFYFLFLGMWRKAITLLVLIFVIYVILGIIRADSGLYFAAFMLSGMLTANPAYYLHRVKKSKSFNIFEGYF
ncbi:hypothetical protein BHC46_05870 [Snodgrassella alvi]|jgi:hypothetical protein|uniref:DUF2628 domain-containing protein n=1 Tax=Snodgrassella alvi TaxID=1196083 RepID=A0A2N9XHK4_9NEIS|nr:DUF2628 domain-containing protein [Snodgrassella alvi]PIT47809.1 hypothetical protein BHC46_05870 [Snodgrassella alvi]